MDIPSVGAKFPWPLIKLMNLFRSLAVGASEGGLLVQTVGRNEGVSEAEVVSGYIYWLLPFAQ